MQVASPGSRVPCYKIKTQLNSAMGSVVQLPDRVMCPMACCGLLGLLVEVGGPTTADRLPHTEIRWPELLLSIARTQPRPIVWHHLVAADTSLHQLPSAVHAALFWNNAHSPLAAWACASEAWQSEEHHAAPPQAAHSFAPLDTGEQHLKHWTGPDT